MPVSSTHKDKGSGYSPDRSPDHHTHMHTLFTLMLTPWGDLEPPIDLNMLVFLLFLCCREAADRCELEIYHNAPAPRDHFRASPAPSF